MRIAATAGMEIIHPTNDESLVSYHRPELMALLPSLELALDCWSLLDTNGRGSEKAKYLKQEVGEPSSAYRDRLERSTYTPIFRDSIKAYAGLLSRFQLIDVPPSMLLAEQNIDRQGSSIYSFLNNCDQLAIRDGGVFVIVDMPPSPSEGENYIDEKRSNRLPYLVQVERKDLINWSVDYVNGREVLRHATVRQLRSIPTKGYGSVIEPVYLVMKPGLVQTVRLERRDNYWIQVTEDTVETSLPVIPIKWYSASTPKFGQGDLPMNGLAELSIQHYQMRSDLQELLHKCAMPVPVRKGAPIGPSGRAAPLMLGPNTAVDLQENGDFLFAEPSGRSLERHQGEIQHLEALMDRSGLNFLHGSSVKTATEAALRSSQISSQVNALIKNKASAFETVMKLWALYAGEFTSLTTESGLAINDSLINRPIDPSGIAQLVNLRNAGILSRRTVLEELQRGNVIDPDLKIDAEIKRIEEEEGAVQPTVQPTLNPAAIQ